MTARPGLRALCRTLFKHAAFTVGGGGVTMIALEREIVEEHRWLTQDQFRAIYGLARITPGTSILALVTGIGWHFHGWTGAIAALLLNAVPGSFLAALLASGYRLVYGHPQAQAFLAGAAAAVCGLIGATIWKMIEPYMKGTILVGSAVVFGLVFVLAVFDVSPLPVFVALGVAGYLLPEEQRP